MGRQFRFRDLSWKIPSWPSFSAKHSSATEEWMKEKEFHSSEVRRACTKERNSNVPILSTADYQTTFMPTLAVGQNTSKRPRKHNCSGLPLYPVYDQKAAEQSIAVLVHSIRTTLLSLVDPFAIGS